MTTETLPRLLLRPYRDGYGFGVGRNTFTTTTESGCSRQRIDRIGMPHSASAAYKCTPVAYQYLMSFLRQYEGQPFLAPLLLDDIDHHDYECLCLDDSRVNVTTQGNQLFIVQLTLEAKPIADISTNDAMIVEIYNSTDGVPIQFLSNLQQLTSAMPTATVSL